MYSAIRIQWKKCRIHIDLLTECVYSYASYDFSAFICVHLLLFHPREGTANACKIAFVNHNFQNDTTCVLFPCLQLISSAFLCSSFGLFDKHMAILLRPVHTINVIELFFSPALTCTPHHPIRMCAAFALVCLFDNDDMCTAFVPVPVLELVLAVCAVFICSFLPRPGERDYETNCNFRPSSTLRFVSRCGIHMFIASVNVLDCKFIWFYRLDPFRSSSFRLFLFWLMWLLCLLLLLVP